VLADERGEDQRQPDVEDVAGGRAEMIETALPHPNADLRARRHGCSRHIK